jgi:hypothetical protein
MTRDLATMILGVVLFAGCSTSASPATSPAFTLQAECERNHGVWRADLGGVCEGGGPIR